jgi:hypothetical protein
MKIAATAVVDGRALLTTGASARAAKSTHVNDDMLI